MSKPIDEWLYDFACELEACGFDDGPVLATIELPKESYFRLLGHMSLKMVPATKPRPGAFHLSLEIMSDSGRKVLVKPSAS